MSKNQEVSTKKIEKASGKGEGPLEKTPDQLVSPFYASDEGRRQNWAKIEQQQRIEDAPKEKSTGKKKSSIAEDPRRYYGDSDYQKKIVEINTKIASSNDKEEKTKMQKELDKLEDEVEERQEEEKEQSVNTQGGSVGSTTTTTLGGQAFGQRK